MIGNANAFVINRMIHVISMRYIDQHEDHSTMRLQETDLSFQCVIECNKYII